jgi:hypothetical protein
VELGAWSVGVSVGSIKECGVRGAGGRRCTPKSGTGLGCVRRAISSLPSRYYAPHHSSCHAKGELIRRAEGAHLGEVGAEAGDHHVHCRSHKIDRRGRLSGCVSGVWCAKRRGGGRGDRPGEVAYGIDGTTT